LLLPPALLGAGVARWISIIVPAGVPLGLPRGWEPGVRIARVALLTKAQ
jgi:hypothetical protein